jgi:L-arabinose isomerase
MTMTSNRAVTIGVTLELCPAAPWWWGGGRCRKPDRTTSAECWLTAGGPHHTVLSAAVGTEELTDLAEMLHTELLAIDADTSPRRFRSELRWNAACHRLGLGG